MTRTEKAIRDARIHLGKCFYPDKPAAYAMDMIHEAYIQERSFSRFKTVSYCIACLSIGLMVVLIINA